MATVIHEPTPAVMQLEMDPSEVRQWQDTRFQRRQRRTLRKYTDENGQVRPDSWRRGIESLRRMSVAAPAAAVTGVTGTLWSQIGPAPLKIDQLQVFQGVGPDSGEVVDIAIDPSGASDQTIFVATNDGGVWKSTDGAATWTAKTEFMPSLSMGAVALDPDNPQIVYAGTGNLFDGGGGGGGAVPGGFSKIADIYKSIDGGETWSVIPPSAGAVGTFFSGKGCSGVNRIVVLPGSGPVVVATDKGLFRSTDGGQTFSEIALGSGATTGAFISDLARDTISSTTTLYACANGLGIFQSTDSGATFPANLFLDGAGNAKPNTPTGFGELTFTQSTVEPVAANNGKTMYASVQGGPGGVLVTSGYNGLYKSSDGGSTWTQLPTAGANAAALENGDQAGYDRTVGVDPQDPTRVYIAFQEMYVSTDGGNTFTKFSGGATPQNVAVPSKIHWDHHVMIFSPRSHWGAAPTQLYVGTDGGIATNPDGVIADWKNLNGTASPGAISSSLFLGIDMGRGSAANNAFTFGGAQDTGLSGHRASDTGIDWHLAQDGDGGPVVVDPQNPQKVFGTSNGEYDFSLNGGTTWNRPLAAATGLPACPKSTTSCAQTLAVDPNTSNNVYAASGTQLFLSTDGGNTFVPLPNLTPAANVLELAITAADSNRIWVGMADGTVQFTKNALAGAASAWSAPANQPGPGVPVGGLAINPSNLDQVVAVYSGGGAQKRVLMTSDSGASPWQDITGSIDPNLILNSVVIDPSTAPPTIVVASVGTVLISTDTGATWNVLGVGLPSVDCTSLAFEHRNGQPSLLRVGTYGRSAFELTAPTGQSIFVKTNLAFGVVPLNTQSSPLTLQIFNLGDTDLHVSGISLTQGSADFQAPSGPALPATVTASASVQYTVQFQPSKGGIQTAVYQVQSDDPARPTISISASGMSPVALPAVSSIAPTSGAAAGGDSVTITGSGFTGATAVNFGANAATNLNVGSDTQISCTSPAGNGTVDVTVVGPGGTSPTSAADQFTYAAAGPAVSGIAPTSGAAAGGDSVTITGSGFTGATAVNFGANAATNLNVGSDTQITCTSPAGNGTVDVTVVGPGGTSATSAADQFTYS